MSFNIDFDYRFDTSGFFDNQAARDALEAAANIWEGLIGDEFANVPAGVDFFVSNPVDGSSEHIVLEQEIDDLMIFVGASATPFGISLGGEEALPEGMCDCAACAAHHGTEGATTLARAGYSGIGANGDALTARVTSNFRGQGPATDFEPFVGVASFNDTVNWNFDVSTPVPGQFDFLTVALHEIGHVLGVGTAPAWDAWISGGFTGPNARAANDGAAVPVDASAAHIAAGFAGNTVLMDPSIGSGQRVLPSAIDLGILADIGYEIAGTVKQGTRFDIVTEGNDQTVFGMEVADHIDALGGDDRILGSTGDDTLLGGAGNDSLFGQGDDDDLSGGSGNDYLGGGTGADTLDGGTGSDTLYGETGTDVFSVSESGAAVTVGDLDLASETIRIGSVFGFASAADVLATAIKPFGNVTRLVLDGQTTVDVFHANQSGTPLTAANIALEPAANAFPLAVADTASVEIGATVLIDVLANDSDPDGDSLSILFAFDGQFGTAAIESGQIRYTPLPGVTAGTDVFSYVIDDGNGGQAETNVTVTLTTAPTTADRIEGTAGGDALAPDGGRDTVLGFAGDDTLSGSPDDDYMLGGGDNDRLFGEAGADRLEGGTGFDTLLGHDGDDRLTGDAGVATVGQGDLLNGGSGDDTLLGDGGADTLFGGEGADLLIGGQGFDQLNGNVGPDSLEGGSERDTLNGEAGADTILGGLGNDVVNGGADPDQLWGGSGNDMVDGGTGDDTLNGEAGNDILLGGAGADLVDGGSGNDVVRGGSGNDALSGGSGDDRIFAGSGNDSVTGGTGIDLIFGNAGDDTLDGGSERDSLVGEDGDDSLVGGGGNDLLVGGAGADRLEGGSGNDLLDGSAGPEADILSGGGGDDILFGQGGGDALSGGSGVDVLFGGDGADVVAGGADGDRLFGQDGDDSLMGDGGADLLFGNLGADLLDGGAGADTLVGEAGADSLLGGGDADTLRGGNDGDTLVGGEGPDALTGGAGADQFHFAPGDGADIVTDFSLAEDTIVFDTTGGGPTGMGDLSFGADGGGNATVGYAGGDLVTFAGVDQTDLETTGNFLFV